MSTLDVSITPKTGVSEARVDTFTSSRTWTGTRFYQGTTILGQAQAISRQSGTFDLRLRNGDVWRVYISPTTDFQSLRNLDEVDRNTWPQPKTSDNGSARPSPVELAIQKYIREGQLLCARGICYQAGNDFRFEARNVVLLQNENGEFYFEQTHWWLQQISILTDEWLDDLFGDRRSYQFDDFAALYATNLNILGGRTDEKLQECATLSRLIYGISSAYLLTGSKRFYNAAEAGVNYLRETFRSLSHDGVHCFWNFGRRRLVDGSRLIVASQNPDDAGTYAIYEQIYALAGLAQYFRITLDWEVLLDIQRTINAFQEFFLDSSENHKRKGYPGKGGYFSHIDPATMRPDSEQLGPNRLRKNWNSIGDHIPAYLVNVLLALDPMPAGVNTDDFSKFIRLCRGMLVDCVTNILTHFPDSTSDYVNERFDADWNPDHTWGWQQDRAIVGHNCKIAWNLVRCAHYFTTLSARLTAGGDFAKATRYEKLATDCYQYAEKLARTMASVGVDLVRGGIFDAVERHPSNGMPTQFVWQSTKDFWQQEQAILAYYINYGVHGATEFRDLARDCTAFWNLFFLDHDNRGIYFRTTEGGDPVIAGSYSQKAGHSVAGYHSWELNYLAHIYIRSYVLPGNFVLFFRPSASSGFSSINVLPDFMRPSDVKIVGIRIDGEERTNFSPTNFQIPLEADELDSTVQIEFASVSVDQSNLASSTASKFIQ
jgi:mannose/cellobiose epimerase-like protein (N-acyl-D-glucosamine 2-epimerase family)